MCEVGAGTRLSRILLRRLCAAVLSVALSACDIASPPVPAASFTLAGQSLRLGVTDALNKVFADPPHEFNGAFSPSQLSLALARNESESLQLVLWPDNGMDGVDVLVDGPATAGLEVSIRPVGFVNMVATKRPESRGGWHPDVLLDNQSLTLHAGQPQPVLVTVHAGGDLAAGIYHRQLRVRFAGEELTIPLAIEVWDFTLPLKGALKAGNLFSWPTLDAMWPSALGYEKLGAAAREKLFLDIADLGFRNRLPPTFFMVNGLSSWNWQGQGNTTTAFPVYDDGVFNAVRTGRLLDYMLAKGANHFFIALTGNIFRPDNAALVRQRKSVLANYLAEYGAYLAAKGLTDMAYIYGIDEPWDAAVDDAKRTFTLVDAHTDASIRFLQNTNQNNSRILDELAGSFDAIDINLGWYHVNNLAHKRRRQPQVFKEAWWNVNFWPDTHPNLFLEYPLSDARVIGSMSFRFEIQGFEYWQLFYAKAMNNYHPVAADEFRVGWDVNEKSLDGNLIYPGENYKIYSSLRLEALRDGFEDYEYLSLLRTLAPQHPLLKVPLVKSIGEFERSAVAIEDYRRQLASAVIGLKNSL